MPKNIKPTKEQVARLVASLGEINQKIAVMVAYHNKRVSFFKAWEFTLNILNAVVGVGALFLIGWQLTEGDYTISSTKISLSVATVTVFLLFFGKLLDFSKKAGNHSWLATIYRDYNRELSYINLTTWNDLSAEDYRKLKDLHDRLKEGINNLRKIEFPILEFEMFLCELKIKITEEKQGFIFLNVNWWFRFWANYFSMQNSLARFIAKHNSQLWQEERQEQQEQQEQQKNTP